MECRMTYDERGPWQCQVWLRIETDRDGNKMQAREEKFGPLLTNKADLEEMLRRAQLAILNPSLPSDTFVEFDTSSLKPGERPSGSHKQLQFSNNVVCLDLSGPDVIDLSFIDLPGERAPLIRSFRSFLKVSTGIIANVAEGDDRGNIEAVKQMVTRHIQGNTLILLTITMRGVFSLQCDLDKCSNPLDDIDNQGAAHLARIEDKDGLRTIGKFFMS